jgi:predicted extracellular nuclease
MYKYIYILLFLYGFQLIEGQNTSKRPVDREYLILFYNTENFFDTYDDPDKNDNDFLPTSKRYWTKDRYFVKLEHISKVILSSGIEPPVIAGFAEVENLFVLKDLTQNTPLSKFNYKIIHHDSPDPRGIDVAVIYRPDVYKPIRNIFYKIVSTKDHELHTREILYSKGILNTKDTIHVFVNHWPSRIGGLRKSEPKRIIVARMLRSKIDSINNVDRNAKIIIMGDFNDEPDNKSITEILQAENKPTNTVGNQLVNLSSSWLKEISWKGTYKYKGRWSVFDQLIVSNALLKEKDAKLKCDETSALIFYSDFLLKEDENNSGKKPFKTYNGMKYLGGFGDHLPVLLRLTYNE